MNIVITMAGLGSRFTKAGYKVPKYRIEAHGKTLFEWSMLSLADFFPKASNVIFIVRKENDSRDFILKECARLSIPNPNIIEIDYLTDGQATTAMLAKDVWNKKEPLLIYNIDTFVRPYAMKACDCKGDGFIPCFKGEGDHWSFVALGEDGRATEVKEKVRISPHCTVGAYWFSSAELYENTYNEFFGGDFEGEKYIAPMYDYMVKKGANLYISSLEKEDVFVLGTPEELDVFNKEFGAVKDHFLREV